MHRTVLFFFLFITPAFSQTDSVYLLKETLVNSLRLDAALKISKSETADSSLKSASISLTDLLEKSGGVYIKDNGAGRLATISIRGTSASQNNVFWNGLSLNSPTLALFDL
jgi:outer membrane cobalamin receptor